MPRPRRRRDASEIAQQAARLAALGPRPSAMARWVRRHLDALEVLLDSPEDPWRLEDVAAALQGAGITYRTGRLTREALNARLVEARKARRGARAPNNPEVIDAVTSAIRNLRTEILSAVGQMDRPPRPPTLPEQPPDTLHRRNQDAHPNHIGDRHSPGPLVFSPSAAPAPAPASPPSEHDSEERLTLLALARKANP